MLETLHAAGIVTHVPQVVEQGKSIQWQALRHAWQHDLRRAADWAIVSDVDEFLNIHVPGNTIDALIELLPKSTDALVLPWRLFGCNRVLEIEDRPVTEQFTSAISKDTQFPIAASMFKVLFRINGPFNRFGVHRPKQKDPSKADLPVFVDGSGRPMPKLLSQSPSRLSLYGFGVARELVELNHYSIRSAKAFVIKSDRGLPNRSKKPIDLKYWVERNFNTVEDYSISTMRPATEKALASLIEIPGLSDLHIQSLVWHKARFEKLIGLPQYQELMSQVLTAGGSTVLPGQLQRQLVRWYQFASKKSS